MNTRRATKLKRMARCAVAESTPDTTTADARAKLTDKLYRSIRRHWKRLNHRERGRFSARDVVAGLRALQL